MTSNHDILSFLEADQEAKAREKEEEKVIRDRERKEDMEHILAVIQRGIQKEVRAAIEPLEERLEQQEKVNKELFTQLNSLKEEFGLLKETMKEQEGFPALPQSHGQQVNQLEDNWVRRQVIGNGGVDRGAGQSENNDSDIKYTRPSELSRKQKSLRLLVRSQGWAENVNSALLDITLSCLGIR